MLKHSKNSLTFLIVAIIFIPSMSFADEVSHAHICKAAMATIMDQDIKTIKIDRVQKQISHISFFDLDDNIKWQFKCLMEDERIQWATKMGNWRNTRLDSIVTYERQGDKLWIQESHNNGSVFKKEFNINELSSDHDIDRK